MNVRQLVEIKPSERQIAWQELGFTAFLHFGINTFTNREWGTGQEAPSLYAPSRLDTDQWCEALVSAGIRACILTAKHHDGFCLFDTAFTKHGVMSSPYPHDAAASLAASCKKYGLKMGLYLSPWDRHEPSYGSAEYNDFFCGQLEEICARYGKLYSLWFDGACGEGPNGKRQVYDWDRYYGIIRRLQPEAAISVVGPDVRWVGNEAGVTRPSEWSVVPSFLKDVHRIGADSQHADDPAFRERPILEQDLGSRELMAAVSECAWYPAETDVSIRPGWFYHPEEDDKVKSLETLLDFYETSAGGNAVLLLNIPPNREGRISAADCGRLAELGAALREIYGRNLLEGPGVRVHADSEAPGCGAANVLGTGENYWRPAGERGRAEIEIELPAGVEITRVELREQIRESQRVEEFSLYAETNGTWEKIYAGTTVGFRKICRFARTKTAKLRVVIEQSRVYPTLRFIGAYNGPEPTH